MNVATTKTQRRTIGIEQAGAMLGISRQTSYKLAKLDQFPVPIIRLGRRMVVSADAVELLLNRQKDQAEEHVEGEPRAA